MLRAGQPERYRLVRPPAAAGAGHRCGRGAVGCRRGDAGRCEKPAGRPLCAGLVLGRFHGCDTGDFVRCRLLSGQRLCGPGGLRGRISGEHRRGLAGKRRRPGHVGQADSGRYGALERLQRGLKFCAPRHQQQQRRGGGRGALDAWQPRRGKMGDESLDAAGGAGRNALFLDTAPHARSHAAGR